LAADDKNKRLCAVLIADIAGYTKLVEQDTDGTVAAWQTARANIIDPAIADHSGRVVKFTGDGFLAEFRTVQDAVKCAVIMQNGLASGPLDFRIGINLGDIIDDGQDIHGEGVNIAARIEALAAHGGICISGGVYDQVHNQLDYSYEDMGVHEVKHVSDPVRVYGITTEGSVKKKPGKSNLSETDKPSIVILPFENLTGDSEQDFLADGLRIDIQNALVKVSGVFLIAVGSANAYRGKPANQATTDLGVRFALAGSVRRASDRVRISLTLTDEASDEIVWAEQYDRQLDDAFALLDEITGNVLTALNVKLVAGESAKVWHKTLKDLRSLEAFYRGIHAFFNMDQLSLSEARRQFELVSKLHPEASIGPTWVALTHWYDYQRGWTDSRDESKRLAKDWAEKGAALPDTDGQAFTVLSHLHLIDRDFDAALASGRNAVLNRPSCTHANAFYANVLLYCCEHETALHHIKLAMRYSPIHPVFFKDILAAAHRALGDLDQAEEFAHAAITTDPKDLNAQLILTSLAVQKNESEKCAGITKDICNIDPAFSIAKFAETQPYRNQKFLDEFLADLRSAGLPK
jgi:TolB-like protein/class 3 adenylate cyclase